MAHQSMNQQVSQNQAVAKPREEKTNPIQGARNRKNFWLPVGVTVTLLWSPVLTVGWLTGCHWPGIRVSLASRSELVLGDVQEIVRLPPARLRLSGIESVPA